MLTVLKYGNLFENIDDDQWKTALNYTNAIPELNYLTQIVIMLYEDPNVDVDSDKRFHVELHFSPGSYSDLDLPSQTIKTSLKNNEETINEKKIPKLTVEENLNSLVKESAALTKNESLPEINETQNNNLSSISDIKNNDINKDQLSNENISRSFSNNDNNSTVKSFLSSSPISTKTKQNTNLNRNNKNLTRINSGKIIDNNSIKSSNLNKSESDANDVNSKDSNSSSIEKSKPRSFEDHHHHHNRMQKIKGKLESSELYNHYNTFHGNSNNNNNAYSSLNQVFKTRFKVQTTNSSPDLNRHSLNRSKQSKYINLFLINYLKLILYFLFFLNMFQVIYQDLIKVRYIQPLETLHNNLCYTTLDKFLTRMINDKEMRKDDNEKDKDTSNSSSNITSIANINIKDTNDQSESSSPLNQENQNSESNNSLSLSASVKKLQEVFKFNS